MEQPGSDSSATEAGPDLLADTTNAVKPRRRWTLRRWLDERFDWSWFTCTQSTGGIAVLLSECPHQFRGLQTIGIVIYLLNLVLLAPIAVQLVHLLIADLYWMTAVLFGATALAGEQQTLGNDESVDRPVAGYH